MSDHTDLEFKKLVKRSLLEGTFRRGEPRGYGGFFRGTGKRITESRLAIPLVDVFSGAGGSSLGMTWAGFRPILAIDIDEYATSVYYDHIGARYGTRVFTKDVEQILKRPRTVMRHLREFPNHVLIGCPPCQGFSTLGKKDPEDERNRLIYAYLKFVKLTKPTVVIFENVFGLRKYEEHSKAIVEGLASLGYKVLFGLRKDGSLDIVNAAYYGVPQIRRRVIVIATNDAKFAEAFEPPVPFRFSESDLRVAELDGSVEETNTKWLKYETVREWIGDLPPVENGGRVSSIPNHRAPDLRGLTMKRILAVPKDGGSLRDAPEELWIPCHRKPNYRDKYKDVLGRLAWDRPSVTIKGNFLSPTTGRYVHPEQDRGLTIREGARLQTFPDVFVFPDKMRVAAKLIGNAFPPRLSFEWGRAIAKAMLEAGLS